MVGRAPDSIQIVRPMRDGVIADFVVTEGMLHHLIGKVQGRQRLFRPEIMICVPSGVTSVERRAVTEAAISAGARQAWLIDEPLAAAIGVGLPIAEPRGNAICDIGGGTTEIAVISMSGMVVAHSIRVGGNRIDDAIASYLKRTHNLLIGERTAEEVKVAAGSAVSMKQPLVTEVRGRDVVTGLPKNVQVTSNDIVEAIQEPLRLIVGAVRAVLEETPPELAADRPDWRLVVFGPAGGVAHVPEASYHLLPRTRLIGRHLQWPAAMRRLKPDVYFGPAGAMPLGRIGIPSAITVHDLAIYRNPRWFPGRQPLSTRLVVPRSILRADVVIAVSENTARDIVELFGIDRARIHVVPHGISPKLRPMGAEELADARARLGLPERFILFVGTIEPRKHLETLLDAWATMRDRPDHVVVGSWGWRYEAIRDKMARLGPRLHHMESVDPDELPAIYNLARALAHPAWYEGFGLPPLEAMACGTPVVVSDTSSLPEVVGDAGLVVAAGDADAWRKALEKILGDHDLAADLRRRGILRAAEFSWSRSAAMTWEVIEEAIGS